MFLARRVLRGALVRFYQPDYIVMPRKDGHWVDPEECTRRISNIIKAHDAVKDASTVHPSTPFADMGLGQLDLVEVFLEVERDFFLEFTDEQVEGFKTIEDAVKYVSNYRFADTY